MNFIFDIVFSWIGHATAYDILTALFTDYSILYPDTLYTHIISYNWTILSFSCALLLIYEQVQGQAFILNLYYCLYYILAMNTSVFFPHAGV